MESNLLVVAKAEYTTQLQEILTHQIFEGMISIWESVKSSGEKQLLKKFQQQLCNIPKWNQDIINREYDRIIANTSKDYLDKLIEAVFLSNVKILSIVKLNSKSAKTIDVNVPETKHFIHMCYIETARSLYSDPHLMEDRETHISQADIHRNIKRMIKIIEDCIEKTIRKMIPMEDILDKYLRGEMEEKELESAESAESEPDSEPEIEHERREPEPEPESRETPELERRELEGREPEGREPENPVDDLFMSPPVSQQQPQQQPQQPVENMKIKMEQGNFFTDSDSGPE